MCVKFCERQKNTKRRVQCTKGGELLKRNVCLKKISKAVAQALVQKNEYKSEPKNQGGWVEGNSNVVNVAWVFGMTCTKRALPLA